MTSDVSTICYFTLFQLPFYFFFNFIVYVFLCNSRFLEGGKRNPAGKKSRMALAVQT